MKTAASWPTLAALTTLSALALYACMSFERCWPIAFVALIFGTLNVVGGFLVTDRMLGMFKGKKEAAK